MVHIGEAKVKEVAVVSRDGMMELRRSFVGCLAVLSLLVQGAESCYLAETDVVKLDDRLWAAASFCVVLIVHLVELLGRHTRAKARTPRTSRHALEGES